MPVGEHLLSSDQQRPVALVESEEKRFDIQFLSTAIPLDCFGRKERSV